MLFKTDFARKTPKNEGIRTLAQFARENRWKKSEKKQNQKEGLF
jgi:hypothetical protein